jgi:hypothetical protein
MNSLTDCNKVLKDTTVNILSTISWKQMHMVRIMLGQVVNCGRFCATVIENNDRKILISYDSPINSPSHS